MFLGSLYCKPYGPRPDCSQTSQVDAFNVTHGVTGHSLILILKALITTVADDKFCHIFPNFRQK